jgi:hypothetical protein
MSKWRGVFFNHIGILNLDLWVSYDFIVCADQIEQWALFTYIFFLNNQSYWFCSSEWDLSSLSVIIFLVIPFAEVFKWCFWSTWLCLGNSDLFMYYMWSLWKMDGMLLCFSQEYRNGDLSGCEHQGYDYSGRTTVVRFISKIFNIVLWNMQTNLVSKSGRVVGLMIPIVSHQSVQYITLICFPFQALNKFAFTGFHHLWLMSRGCLLQGYECLLDSTSFLFRRLGLHYDSSGFMVWWRGYSSFIAISCLISVDSLDKVQDETGKLSYSRFSVPWWP